MPLIFFRCEKCRREFPSREAAEKCEAEHLTVISAEAKTHSIHKYPYAVEVTFSDGETREYVADNMR